MLLVFTALTVVMTYPQVLHLRAGVHDDGDPLLGTWIFAWIAHQLPRAPAHLFDANMYYPERRTLALQETMLLPGAAAAALHWLGVHPVLVHNVILLSGFILSGVGMALLVRMLTNSAGAGLVAGIVFAFVPFRIDHYAHVQMQQTQCLPWAMWALRRVAEAVTNFPDERSMTEIRRHGTNYLVIHGERLRGNRYETLTAALDHRADLKLVGRRPRFALGKHSTISAYRILQMEP
jgi:hypothetical protein